MLHFSFQLKLCLFLSKFTFYSFVRWCISKLYSQVSAWSLLTISSPQKFQVIQYLVRCGTQPTPFWLWIWKPCSWCRISGEVRFTSMLGFYSFLKVLKVVPYPSLEHYVYKTIYTLILELPLMNVKHKLLLSERIANDLGLWLFKVNINCIAWLSLVSRWMRKNFRITIATWWGKTYKKVIGLDLLGRMTKAWLEVWLVFSVFIAWFEISYCSWWNGWNVSFW